MCRLNNSAWMGFYRVVIGFIISIFLAIPVSAQDILTEQEMLGEIPMVISASRLAQPITEAPAAITIIDQEMIEASGARNLVDVFRLVPGFVTANFDGHRAAVSPYGMVDIYARRMQVLIDGRSVFLPSFGGVAWSNLPLALEDIDRIEVVRGPNAVIYGANSFLGVINILTKPAAATRGVHIKYTTGSQDTRDSLAQYGVAGEKLDYRITLGYQKDTGFVDILDNRRAPFFDSRVDYRIDDNDTVNLQIGAISSELGEGAEGSSSDLVRDEKVSSDYQHIRWTHFSDISGEYTLQYYRNYQNSRDSYTFFDPVFQTVLVNNNIEILRQDLEFQHKLRIGPVLRVVWGASGRHEHVRAEKIFNTPSHLENNLSRLFLNTEWRLTPDLLLQGGIMSERTTITEGDLSPRAAINYHITPLHTLRASYSKAFRNPVLVEEQSEKRICAIDLAPNCGFYDPEWRATGGLIPEKIEATEIGYMAQLSNSFSFDVRVFRNRMENLIEWKIIKPADDVIDDVLTFVNSDNEVTLDGHEVQLSYSPDNNNRLMLSYAHLNIDSLDDNNKAKFTPSVPRNTASLLAIHNFQDGYKGSVGYYFVDELRHVDSNDDEQLDARRQLDLRLSREFDIGSSEAILSAVIQNALDDYDEYNIGNIVSTRYYISFGLSFK